VSSATSGTFASKAKAIPRITFPARSNRASSFAWSCAPRRVVPTSARPCAPSLPPSTRHSPCSMRQRSIGSCRTPSRIAASSRWRQWPSRS
jgi:hypothetical protein